MNSAKDSFFHYDVIGMTSCAQFLKLIFYNLVSVEVEGDTKGLDSRVNHETLNTKRWQTSKF